MRVLMLSWEYPPHVVGGIGTHVSALLPALARRGVELTLITPRWAGGELETRIEHAARIFRVDPSLPPSGNIFADARDTNRKLEEFANSKWPWTATEEGQGGGEFDLIHAHDWLVAFAAVALKKLHKAPLVATIHATERGRGRGNLLWEMSQSINQIEWNLIYEAWRVMTPSRFMAEEIESYFQCPADKIEVVPNGVDAARFEAVDGDSLAEFRKRWAQEDEKIIFFVGRLEFQKGAHLLVEAAPKVIHKFPQAKFILAGTGGMEHSLRRRIGEMGLSEKVQMTGFVSDKERDMFYGVADVAVFPSLYEPFGIVALEAMAARCPVVVSNVGGLAEVVTHNETGIIVQPDDIESLAWGIGEVLSKPDECAKRVVRAYEMVKEKYTWDRIADGALQVYERVLRERRQAVWG